MIHSYYFSSTAITPVQDASAVWTSINAVFNGYCMLGAGTAKIGSPYGEWLIVLQS